MELDVLVTIRIIKASLEVAREYIFGKSVKCSNLIGKFIVTKPGLWTVRR